MQGWRKHPLVLIVAALIGLGLAGAIGFLLRSKPGSIEAAMALGVGSSLIASFVFGAFIAVFVESRGRQLEEHLEELRSSVAALGAAVPVLAQAEAYAVQTLKPKGDYSEVEWLGVLDDAGRSLTLVGHALDKWCRTSPLEKEFCTTIRRVLKAGGEVYLLMLAEDAKRVPERRRKEYRERVESTLSVVAGLAAELNDSEAKRLVVRCLGDKLEMPYMAVANEHFMITAPYPATTQNSDKMPAMKLGAQSPVAKELAADVAKLINDAARVELKKYLGRETDA